MTKPNLRTITRTRTIPVGVDDVWTVLTDFGYTHRYNPVVVASHSTTDMAFGGGAGRRCQVDASGRKHIEETNVDLESGSMGYTVETVGGNGAPPMRRTIEINAEPASPTATLVTMTAHLDTERSLHRLVAPIDARSLGTVLDQVLAGLELHLATGQEIMGVDDLEDAGLVS